MARSARLVAMSCALAVVLSTMSGVPRPAARAVAATPEIPAEILLAEGYHPDQRSVAPADVRADFAQRSRSPLGAEGFARAKAYAASPEGARAAEAAGHVDDIEEFAGPEPLAHVVNASFAGLTGVGPYWATLNAFMAASAKTLLLATRRDLRLATPTGSVMSGTAFTAFFGIPSLDDTRLYFDRNAVQNRFYVVASRVTRDPDTSRFYVAVSRSGSPADFSERHWCFYSFNTVREGGTAYENWASLKGLGAGQDALMITSNHFSFRYSEWRHGMVWVLNKIALASNSRACPARPKVYSFRTAAVPHDWRSFYLQPVRHYSDPSDFPGTTNPAYLVNAAIPFPEAADYRVWRVRNVASGLPTLAATADITGNYVISEPPNAVQAGTGVLLVTYETDITEAAGVGNSLWAVHATACNMGGGPAESCLRVLRFVVGQDGSGSPIAVISQQATLGGGAGTFYWGGGIAVNLAGENVVVFQRSSTRSYLSTFFTGKASMDSSYEPAHPVKNGNCPWDNSDPAFNNRSTSAQTTVDGASFWMSGERALLAASGACQWQTWSMKVAPP